MGFVCYRFGMESLAGILALVGSGEYLPPMEPVDRYLLSRLSPPVRVVCLPTAAGAEGAERIRYWSDLGVAHFTRLGVTAEAVEVVDRAGAEDERMASQVAEASLVYLSGGKPDYLHSVLAGSRVWEAIRGVLSRGGVVAGCSAGAMIFGEKMPAYRNPFVLRPAFAFLRNTVILPHFDEIPETFVRLTRLALPMRYTLIGVEGNTALVFDDGKPAVFGSGQVVIWNRAGRRSYKQGDRFPMDRID
jgi:cyanophycinase